MGLGSKVTLPGITRIHPKSRWVPRAEGLGGDNYRSMVVLQRLVFPQMSFVQSGVILLPFGVYFANQFAQGLKVMSDE
jgi:hypothetical protein